MRRGVEHRGYKTLEPSDHLRDSASETFKSYQKQKGPAKAALKGKKKKMKKEEDSSSEDERGQEMTTFRRPQGEAAGIMMIKGSAKPKYGPLHGEVPVATPDNTQQALEIDDAIGEFEVIQKGMLLSKLRGESIRTLAFVRKYYDSITDLLTPFLLAERLGHGPFQRRILVAAGLCFAADSMEVLLLSFLAVVLRVRWDLSEEQAASITSSVFAGALLGTLILGPLGDYVGRKPVFSITAAIITIFGFATGFANNFASLLVCRFLVGFGVGGLTVPFDTLAEFVPSSNRGTSLLAIEYFWTGGTLLVPVLAYFSLGEGKEGSSRDDWRIFVILCAIPCFISTILGVIFVPESPRWLLNKGKHDAALAILRKAAIRNGKNPSALFPPGTRLIDEEDEENGNFCELLAPQWRRIILTMWGAWAGFAFCYYGAIIVITLVFSEVEDENAADESGNLYSFDYAAIFASASSEIAGTTLIILLIDRIGRIPSQTACYIGGGIMVFVLCLLRSRDEPSRGAMVAAAFLTRMFYMSASCTTWVSTAEILTTEIRTTGHSAANAIARFGGGFSPYLITAETPFIIIGITMLAVSLFTAACTYNLPETKGKRMGEAALDERHHRESHDATEDISERSIT